MVKDTNDVSRDFAENMDRLLKFFPIGLGVVYLVGFLIVAFHLARYGASPLDLIKIQYLAAGFWCALGCLLYYGLLALLSFIYFEMMKSYPPTSFAFSRRSASIVASIAVSLIATVGNIAMLHVLRRVPWSSIHREGGLIDGITWFKPIGPIVVLLTFLTIMIQVQLWLREKNNSDRKFQYLRWFLLICSSLGIVMGVFKYIQAFSLFVYPAIPFALGGGQPRSAVFWLGPKTGTEESFLERDGTKSYSIPYELLVESDRSLVVISPKDGQRAIEFDRKAVGAVIILGKRTGPANFQRGVTENLPTSKP